MITERYETIFIKQFEKNNLYYVQIEDLNGKIHCKYGFQSAQARSQFVKNFKDNYFYIDKQEVNYA